MSLADLVPVIQKTRLTKKPIGKAESQRRWMLKNKAKFNAYRREWLRKRKAA